MNKFFGHFKTITTHRHAVIKHARAAGILFQGLFHDLSKYSPTEFLSGVKYYTGTKSPNEGERLAFGYSKAWLHHKGRNKHHFEYWIDYGIGKDVGIVGMEMPTKYVVEMFMDRIAASKTYMKDAYTDACPLEYYEKGKHKYIIHPNTEALLRKLLEMLAQKGEKETFAYIKENVLKNK